MLRIAHISLHGDPLEPLGSIEAGGQNVYVRNVAAELARLGGKVDVFTRWNTPKKGRTEEIAPGARSVRLHGGPQSFVKKERLLEFMEEMLADFDAFCRTEDVQYDLIHTHYYVEGAFGMRLARSHAVPHFHTFHSLGRLKLNHELLQGSPNTAAYADRLEIEKSIMRRADVLVATSPHEAQDFADWYEHDNFNTTIVPCGLDPALFHCSGRRRARQQVGLPQDKIIPLYVGRMEARKGLETLLFAYHKLLLNLGPKADQLLLVIVGGNTSGADPETEAFRKLAAELQLREWDGARGQVFFAGSKPQREVAQHYCAADFTLAPSYYEPFGMVAIETQACGTPAIVSAVGGLRHAVENECGGLHAKPYSCNDLCRQMERMVNDPDFCRRMGRLGRQRVIQKFTWPAIAMELMSEYESVLHVPKRRPAANVVSMRQPAAVSAPALFPARRSVNQMQTNTRIY